MRKNNHTLSALLGLSVGDALGVPVEFQSRSALDKNPVTNMREFGTHNVPAGTFSDDSSLAFCLAEALALDFNLQVIAENFINWKYNSYWTAHGYVFDIGIATRMAIDNLKRGMRPDVAGGLSEDSNGNGSLMRILPLVFYIKDKPIAERFEIIRSVSAITHGHVRSVIACFYYLEFARLLIEGVDKFEIYHGLKTIVTDHITSIGIIPYEVGTFDRLLKHDIFSLPRNQIYSSGYVLYTLEASIWSLLNTSNYRDAVLKAVNLGEDTDTTGAVAGGLAGLLYGYKNIPSAWLSALARRNDIENLARRMEKKLD